MSEERLQKFLADAGVASRRKAEELILAGKVIVNGKKITELGTKVDPEQVEVTCEGKPVKKATANIYIIMNKPAKYVTTAKDQFDRPSVLSLLKKVKQRVYPVGRLDYDTTGLLLITNDGDLTYKLTHPSKEIAKTYLAKVKDIPTEEKLEQMRKGVSIDGKKTQPAKVSVNKMFDKNCELMITIHEGRNRQVRKMCEKIGHEVIKLERISIGNLKLGELPVGEYRMLTPRELEYLKQKLT
ncbi:MAG TPA: pseudouridine synthase [Clostridiales bacterium]|nr:MAG: pseudouridine synthase [Clostridiales bacterium GWD2_32_19]HCC08126.1 pseudouridine synthase [Clostridiales bacterium]